MSLKKLGTVLRNFVYAIIFYESKIISKNLEKIIYKVIFVNYLQTWINTP